MAAPTIIRFLAGCSLLALALSSCSWLGFGENDDNTQDIKVNPADPTARPDYIPDHMRLNVEEIDGSTKQVSESVSMSEMRKQIEAEGLILINPDHVMGDPEKTKHALKNMTALEQAFNMKRGVDWETDYGVAQREALRSQRPLLMWFADSERSPNSILLATELFSTKEFTDWAEKNVIRLRLDKRITAKNSSEEKKRKNYLREQEKRFNVTGYPRVIILTSDGQKVDELAGYFSGTQESAFRRLKNSVDVAKNQYKNTKERLINLGFREWRGNNGNVLLAKLIKYSPNGDIVLQEGDGRFVRTHLNNVSHKDQQWIAEEKARRANAGR